MKWFLALMLVALDKTTPGLLILPDVIRDTMNEGQTKVSIIEIGIGVGGLGERNGQASPTERLIDIHLGLEVGV